MNQGKHGLQVFDEMGRPLLEVGPHVVSDFPEFAQKIGVIAALWSQAEVNLNCLFAVLLDTTPEEAATELKKHGTAAKATSGARKFAAKALKGAELDFLNETLDQLDRARQQRNRVQHDVWARKAGDSRRVFAIHSNEYLALVTELMTVQESTDGKDASLAIEVAMAFASEVSNGYAIEDLEEIARVIDSVSKSLLHAMFHRIGLRLAEE